MATTAACAAADEADELSSALVRECLGFAPASSRLDALGALCASLGRAARPQEDDAAVDAAGGEGGGGEEIRGAWRALLNGPLDGGGGPGPPTAGGGRVLRDGLVRSLVECCRPAEDDDCDLLVDDGPSSEEAALRIAELALRSLARLVRLRPSSAEEKALGVPSDPVFGHDFALEMAADVLRALKADGTSDAASDLVTALLGADRPRNEECGAALRDAVLIPASDVCGGAGNARSTAAVAVILSSSIAEGVGRSVPHNAAAEEMDPEELSMRRETAALGRMQDVRDVLANFGKACTAELRGGGESALLGSLRSIHELAPFAVESQLETLLEDDEAEIVMGRLKGGPDGEMKGVGRAEEDPDASAEMSEDGDLGALNAELRRCDDLPPLYDGLAGGPLAVTSPSQVEGLMADVAGRMGAAGPEDWDVRLAALVDVERILAGGVLSSSSSGEGGLRTAACFVECRRPVPRPPQPDHRSGLSGHVSWKEGPSYCKPETWN